MTSLKVLVIDDDPLIRETLVAILESASHTTVTANDGEQGVRAFRDDRPDVVITDILMPRKEGIETIREIRRLDADVRIVAISGGDRGKGAGYLNLALKLGADSVVAKPFLPAQLLSAVAGTDTVGVV